MINIFEGFDLTRMGFNSADALHAHTPTEAFGGYQVIRWDRENRVFLGASEGRKHGQAVGYQPARGFLWSLSSNPNHPRWCFPSPQAKWTSF